MLAFPNTAKADSVQADSSSFAFLPSFGYNSDLGFAGGITLNRYTYRPSSSPYASFIDLSALVSTRGYYNAQISYDRPEVFGTHARSNFEVFGNRTLNANYFGIGNRTPFSNSLWEDDHYNFESISFGASVRTRHPLKSSDERRFDVLSLAGSSYNIPYDNGNNSLIEQQQPAGFRGGWVNYIGAGLMWDSRDNEIATTRGNQSRLEVYLMPEILLSDYQMAVIYAETSQFLNLAFLANTIVAMRAGFERSFGDVPYWQLPYIGGENTIRGYPTARFRGSSAMFYNLELRNWLVADEFFDVRLGAHVFTDAGRVFNGSNEWDQVLNEHKRTLGFGLALSTFDSDIIFRADYAFSSDMSRLYIGLGYLF